MHSHQFGTYSKPVEQLQVEKVEFWTLFESFGGPWGVLGGSWLGHIGSKNERLEDTNRMVCISINLEPIQAQ